MISDGGGSLLLWNQNWKEIVPGIPAWERKKREMPCVNFLSITKNSSHIRLSRQSVFLSCEKTSLTQVVYCQYFWLLYLPPFPYLSVYFTTLIYFFTYLISKFWREIQSGGALKKISVRIKGIGVGGGGEMLVLQRGSWEIFWRLLELHRTLRKQHGDTSL